MNELTDGLICNHVGVTESQLMPIESAPPVDRTLPVEESDIEFEQLQELERQMVAEDGTQSNKDLDGLNGVWLPFGRQQTGKHVSQTFPINEKRIRRKVARVKNLYDIPTTERGEFYRYFEKQLNESMLCKLKGLLKNYQHNVEEYQIAKVRTDAVALSI